MYTPKVDDTLNIPVPSTWDDPAGLRLARDLNAGAMYVLDTLGISKETFEYILKLKVEGTKLLL